MSVEGSVGTRSMNCRKTVWTYSLKYYSDLFTYVHFTNPVTDCVLSTGELDNNNNDHHKDTKDHYIGRLDGLSSSMCTHRIRRHTGTRLVEWRDSELGPLRKSCDFRYEIGLRTLGLSMEGDGILTDIFRLYG